MISIRRRQLKDLIRRCVENMPYGVGNSIIKFYLCLVGRRKKIFIEKREANRILRVLQNGKMEKVLIVYDELASPPTYGDFLYVVMLARYFICQDITVNLVIVDGDYREDWSELDESRKLHRNADYIKLANLLLNPQLAMIEQLSWRQLNGRIKSAVEKGVDIPFRSSVLARAAVYKYAFNILNYLCAEFSQSQLDQFLLSIEDLEGSVVFNSPKQPYISWHCRRSQKETSLTRNTKNDEFLQIFSRLKALYPSYDIMVVSDVVGCDYFRELARKYKMECHFSKDYSDTFMGDGALILRSKYHFTLRGGGIDVFSIFSQNPYEVFATCVNERTWNREHANVWSSRSQIFTDIQGSTEVFLPSGKVKLE